MILGELEGRTFLLVLLMISIHHGAYGQQTILIPRMIILQLRPTTKLVLYLLENAFRFMQLFLTGTRTV